MEIKQTKDVCVEKLTATDGVELEITANLTSSSQLAAVLEGHIATALNSKYGQSKYRMLLRLTNSWQGRCRDDLTGIGKTPEMQGWQYKQGSE